MERLGALVAALSLAACADIMGFEEGQPQPEAEAASASTVASSSQSTAASGGQGGAGGEVDSAGAGGAPLPTRIAFVSASPIAINPQLGMEALDQFCMSQAADDFPNTQFVAWLSVHAPGAPHVNAQDRIINAEWYRPDGLRIAQSKTDLLDSQLDNPINVKADGNPLGTEAVWTGTQESGNDSPYDCEGWLSDDATSSATLGSSGEKDGDWSHAVVGDCNASHHVYCFEE